MNAPSNGFGQSYAAALEEFLEIADEAGLGRAYELGREAIATGKGVLDLAAVHAQAVTHGLPPALAERAWQFLSEALAPFEMALRGFREANQKLGEAAATLERRVLERTNELTVAERSVREKTRLLDRVVDSMSDGLAVADRDGNFLIFNRAAKELLGRGPVDAPIAQWSEAFRVFHPDETTPFPSDQLPLVRSMLGEETDAVPLFVRPESGPGRHLAILGSPLRDEEGSLTGGLVVFRDMTEARAAQEVLKKTEEQLRQSQKMDAVGRLAGGVAHDFNNVLSVILSFSGLALSDLKPGDPLAEDLKEIQLAGNRAADLTRQLLMFSRQQVVQPRVVDVTELLGGMKKMLDRLIGADVTLTLVPHPAPAKVLIDPGSLEQVVMNLVVNARDAMPTGGQLTIETGLAVLDEEFCRTHLGARPGPHVMLAVTDTGMGMDRATQARIFEPFFSTKEKGKGTGLGLSTVFGIVQQSLGSVWVYSELGRGTTFKVYLPQVDAAVTAPTALRAVEDVRGTETVLLVDDDSQVRAAALLILRRNGYQVLEAQNAGEALLLAETHAGPLHLLLTDVVMPHVSGPELARRLCASRPQLRLLCMSGYTDDTIVRHGVLGSAIAYVQKPFTPEALAQRVREVLNGPQAPPPLRR